MPVYEYKCEKCDVIIEEFQKVDDPPLKICSKCSGILKKLFSIGTISVEYGNPKEKFENDIKPEARKIAERIKAGDEKAAADFFGEGE